MSLNERLTTKHEPLSWPDDCSISVDAITHFLYPIDDDRTGLTQKIQVRRDKHSDEAFYSLDTGPDGFVSPRIASRELVGLDQVWMVWDAVSSANPDLVYRVAEGWIEVRGRGAGTPVAPSQVSLDMFVDIIADFEQQHGNFNDAISAVEAVRDEALAVQPVLDQVSDALPVISSVNDNESNISAVAGQLGDIADVSQNLLEIDLNVDLIRGALNAYDAGTESVLMYTTPAPSGNPSINDGVFVLTTQLLLRGINDISDVILIDGINEAFTSEIFFAPNNNGDFFVIADVIAGLEQNYMWVARFDDGQVRVSSSNKPPSVIINSANRENDINLALNPNWSAGQGLPNVTHYRYLGHLGRAIDELPFYLNGISYNLRTTTTLFFADFSDGQTRVFDETAVHVPDAKRIRGEVIMTLQQEAIPSQVNMILRINGRRHTEQVFQYTQDGQEVVIPFETYGDSVNLEGTIFAFAINPPTPNTNVILRTIVSEAEFPPFRFPDLPINTGSIGATQSATQIDSNIATADNGHGTIVGTVDDNNVDFVTTGPYPAGGLRVTSDALTYFHNAGLTEVDPSAGTFTMDVAPLNNIIAEYTPL